MEEKSNNKYIFFQAFMLLTTIGSYFWSYIHSTYTNTELLKKYDITGMTGICMNVMFIIEIIVLIIAIVKGVKGKREGADYLFNRFMSVLCLVLAVVPILMFVVVRNNEEKLAKDVDVTLSQLKNMTVELENKNNKNTKKSTKKNAKGVSNQLEKILEQRENDKFYERKIEIAQEIEDSKSKLGRYIMLFFYDPIYNDSSTTIVTPSEEKQYYAMFSVYTYINIVNLGFYFICRKDRKTNVMSSILNQFKSSDDN